MKCDCSDLVPAKSCSYFEASTVGSCYCHAELSKILHSYSVAQMLTKLNDQQSSSTCKTFFRSYSLSVGFSYMSIGVTIAINTLTRVLLKILTKHESHTSLDSEEGSLMFKIFLSNYITMSVIVLAAYGKIAQLPTFLSYIHVFDGPYPDFNPDWYGNIGFYFMTTFIVGAFSPLAMSLLEFYVIYPISRSYHYPLVRYV
jgi:hypothetical protein